MASSGDSVVIVGGGVVGLMSAWQLSTAGLQVTVIDQGEIGSGCSHGNCGYICPSHILPLCQPGAVASSMRSLLKPNSPFAIRPRLSRAFMSWFWKFARQCNQADMLATARALHPLLQSSMKLHRQLVFDEGIECEWENKGLLFIHPDQKGFESYAATDRLLREEFGVGATPYSGAALKQLEPALKSDNAGAWHYEEDCHIRPDLLLSGVRSKLNARGVRFVEKTKVNGFDRQGRRARGLRNDGSETNLTADHFVVATGAWTPLLNRELGLRVPIEPGKGYSITTSKPQRMPTHPLIFEDSHVAITPMQSGFRIGSTMEFVGYNVELPPKRLDLLTAAAQKHLVEPLGDRIEERWFGWRPMTWDGRPIIDRSPAMDNVWIAAGHNMLGLTLSTGTGRLVRELMLGEEPHLDPEPFGVARLA